MLKLYHIKGSLPCLKIRMCLAYLKADYQSVKVDLWKGEHQSQPLREMYGAMKVPFIDHAGFVLGESNAILRYLAARFDRFELYPQDLQDRALVDQWMDFSSMHICEDFGVLIWNRYWLPRLRRLGDSARIEQAERSLIRNLVVVEEHLRSRHFLVSHTVTLADIVLFSHLCLWKRTELPEGNYPVLQQWIQSMAEHPAWAEIIAEERIWPEAT